MGKAAFSLMKSGRFLPLFLTQFLGAMNDNLFKNALVILIAYRLAAQDGFDGPLMVTLAAGLFILPFFLFSALAGQLADRFEKSRLIRCVKLSELVIMAGGAAAFLSSNVVALMAVLFLMGVQSSLFGPLKYSILPDHLEEADLIGANALVEAGTFLAILVGTIAGGLMITVEGGATLVSIAIVAMALLGWLASLVIPKAQVACPDLKINANFVAETCRILTLAKENRPVFLSILGISWFWLVGATFLAQFPNLAKDVLFAKAEIVTLFLTLFSAGIAIGSLACNRLLKGELLARHVPLGALGMTLFILDFYFALAGYQPADPLMMQGIGSFVVEAANWRIMLDLSGIAICGGLFIVPLYALLQAKSCSASRSRMVAANNILNAAFIVAGTLAVTALMAVGLELSSLFLALAALNGLVAIYICGLLPETVLKSVLKWCLRVLFRVRVKGLEQCDALGDRAVYVVNHVSFLDAVLLAAFLPGKPTFAINSHTARRWWVRPFLGLVDAYPMDPTNPMAVKGLIQAVRAGRQCVIFPEGRITVTGSLMKIHEGPGMIADKADAPIVPVRIDGAQYSIFSRLKGVVRRRLLPKVSLQVLAPRKFALDPSLKGRRRREMAGRKLHDVMAELMFETQERNQTLFQAVLDAKAIHGGRMPVLEDIERKPVGYSRLVLGARLLGGKLAKSTERGEAVGMLLPNSVGAAVTFFALQAYGRVPAMLNFSAGLSNMRSACKTAELNAILTSRRFVAAAKLEEAVAHLARECRIIYLEDVKAEIGFLDKIRGLLARPFAGFLHGRLRVKPEDAAVILFTSGSEGQPKGVVLSHENLLANRQQLAATVDFSPKDTVFNALPIFHSFGLTGGMLLPVLSGIRTFLYPSPLHYRIVPALAYEVNATILFGTDTFLAGYARTAHAYDFYSLRYVFAGAEKVKDETRKVWFDKFGLRLLEGYGATETAPVLAVNSPMHFQAGTVGRLLPGIRAELKPVPGIEKGGRLYVSGPNIMKGYLMADRPGELQPPAGGWYDTGDIVSIDADGFVTIQGRAKRFAKIAGEMVSLTAVEGQAAKLWPDSLHAVIAVPDARKGEQLVLVTDRDDASRAALSAHAKEEGVAELMVPREVRVVAAVPLLGTGKIDYQRAAELAA
ncbi:acyl-[ACP]--phospholipid O-acyltransferase [Aestuariispira insulae]|uniref:Acyl-[acyl-carrier-protein]-phospholipid O-acyltransferase/long-chain-fatty-acid--[acyl-carrier-protein] ligase n=1 Tax=Aestuariispira insulae TaxID=1461337 RepID=A0A3D9HHT9_9PROT|nr:acyl-[ACP]--phospholipid O-acyltransferase [Aestuariispira insulae]RED49079.1 acyl-[acyl-carrier-protein]-phospholipid O-acyltransferase/long-chain-fatty-acid--[acyl-carrier-protein] ligase [Aestuariispira insulae]